MLISLLVRTGKNGRVEPLDLANSQVCHVYYDRLVEQAKNYLLNALRDFLNGSAPRQFGFVTG